MDNNSEKIALDNLKEKYEDYMSAITEIEDNKNLNHQTREQAISIITEGKIHSDIALEEISN